MTVSCLKNVAEMYFTGGTREFLLAMAKQHQRTKPNQGTKPEPAEDCMMVIEERPEPEDEAWTYQIANVEPVIEDGPQEDL